jgi:uncharacterized protein YdhG (YjbR/CyaY superfamily)
MKVQAPNNIDEYIARFPPAVQEILRKIRRTIQRAAPGAVEAIKYQIPTFVLNGNLVHFAAHKDHIGFYALPTGHKRFEDELSGYKTGKGSVQFPFDKPMPFGLIARIVKYRAAENRANSAAKKKRG